MQNKALIVVDMQNDFITGNLANPDAQKIVNPIADFIRSWDGQLIFTFDTHEDNYLNTQEGKKLPIKHCICGTRGWLYDKEIENARIAKAKEGCNNINILFKPSFGSVLWKEILGKPNKCKYSEIHLCGTCTDICVVSNALIIKAMYPETPIKVYANLCAGSTKEKHEAALQIMESCQIEVCYDKD